MRETAFKLHQGEWEKKEETLRGFTGLSNENKGKIKSRLGFIYFIVILSSLIVLFTS
jgi:hypothetical protein